MKKHIRNIILRIIIYLIRKYYAPAIKATKFNNEIIFFSFNWSADADIYKDKEWAWHGME